MAPEANRISTMGSGFSGLFGHALEIRERLLGQDHPQVARSLNNLALLYEVQRRYTEAESLYQRALMIREQTLGQDNPKTIATRQAYAALQEALRRTTT